MASPRVYSRESLGIVRVPQISGGAQRTIEQLKGKGLVVMKDLIPRSAVYTGYPYPSVRVWFVAMALKVKGFKLPAVERAVETANQLAETAGQKLHTNIGKAWNAQRFSEMVSRMLAMGALLGLAGAGAGLAIGVALGSAVPGIGTVIGAAVGFIAGIVAGIIPTEQWAVIDTWSKFVDQLHPEERYLLYKELRPIFDDLRRRQNLPLFGPWQATTYEFITIYGGPESVAWFCWIELWKRASIPIPSTLPIHERPWEHPRILYGLALCCVDIPPHQTLETSHRWHDYVDDWTGRSPEAQRDHWLAPYLHRNKDLPCGIVREMAIAGGVPDKYRSGIFIGQENIPVAKAEWAQPDYSEPVIDNEIGEKLLQYETELQTDLQTND